MHLFIGSEENYLIFESTVLQSTSLTCISMSSTSHNIQHFLRNNNMGHDAACKVLFGKHRKRGGTEHRYLWGRGFPFSIIWQCSPKQDSGNIDAELPVVPRLARWQMAETEREVYRERRQGALDKVEPLLRQAVAKLQV